MSQLKTLLADHPDWIAPRSDQHTVIGVPNSRDHRKTFVEPGGSFSPGVATFGTSTWLYDHTYNHFYAPETMPAEALNWGWEDGYLPILNSRWRAGEIEVTQQLFAASLSSLENIVNSLQVTLTNTGNAEVTCSLYLVLRPYGPAGGKIHALTATANTEVLVNGKVVMLAGTVGDAFGVTSYTRHRTDISTYLKRGVLPSEQTGEDRDGLCGGALAYHLTLQPQASRALHFDFFVHPLEEGYLPAFRQYHPQGYTHQLATIKNFWEQQLKVVQINVPDQRFTNAWYSMLAQFLVAMVQDEVRISTVTYPLFWLRDGAYIINALDRAGLHDVVRSQLARIEQRIFASGFGADPDAFGEGIWVFFTHFQSTRDEAWLRGVYPALKERAEWIIKARHTLEYLYGDTEARVPDRRYSAQSDLICEPAKDGLIQGRMDWHIPVIWINAFAYLGLSSMVELARVLNEADDALRYQQEAAELQQSLQLYSQEHFGQDERDMVCAIWPSRAFSADDPLIRDRYEAWWQNVRLQGKGEYTPELLWKYFELGQAHNYLFLGEREKTSQTVEYYLTHHDIHNLYGWLEDDHDIAEFWESIEGWYKLPSRQPHGWVASECWLLLRDMLLYEDSDVLVLGAGVPSEWMQYPVPLTLRNAPSAFGPLDFLVTRQDRRTWRITVRFHESQRLPRKVQIRLPWDSQRIQARPGSYQHGMLSVSKEDFEAEGTAILIITQE